MKKYRHKLNMLEPGCNMLKAIGAMALIGFFFCKLKMLLPSYLFIGIAVLIGVVLLILLIIESHQDKVLNQQAVQERGKNGEGKN